MVGQTVGKYRVVSRLGRGGMGTVYKAVDETLEREVAIKCLNPDVGDAEVLKRFRAEAITLARLNHPNIATLFELTEHDGQLLMVMEFVRGETFDKVSQTGGPMPVERAARLCGQVFDALEHAHRARIVHRDLKPANLMLTESGIVKVMDFGLARMAGTERLTNDGYMVGTPAYMSPEQIMGWDIDGRADLYAMGVVLFRLLTGQLPFKADSGIAMAQKQINDPPTPVRQLRTELSAEVENILKRALSKPPGDRYQTAESFKAALSAAVGATGGALAEPALTLAMSRTLRFAEDEATVPLMPTPVATARSQVGPVAAPEPVPSPSSGRRIPIAAAVGVGALLLAGVPATMVWRARSATPAVTVESAPAPSAPSAPSTPSASSPLPAASPPAVTAATGPALTSGTAPVARAGGTVAPKKSEAALPATGPDAALPLVTFGKMKLLVIDGGRSRDRDASLRLGPDGLQVMDGEKTIQSVAYGDVIGLFQSHSREPKWVTPDGTAVPVAKAGGKFGFLKGTPDWITVRTKNLFIPLRVPEDDLGRVIAELEARTGAKAVRTR